MTCKIRFDFIYYLHFYWSQHTNVKGDNYIDDSTKVRRVVFQENTKGDNLYKSQGTWSQRNMLFVYINLIYLPKIIATLASAFIYKC